MKKRPYQQEALAKIPSNGRCIIELPTGCGKTPIAVWKSEERGGRVLYLAHRDELLQQASDKYRIIMGQMVDLGLVQGQSNEVGAQVVLASIQTVSRPNRLEWLKQDWDMCVVDEAHHAFSPSYRRVIDFVKAPLTVGFTATAYRTQGMESLREVFQQGVVYRKSLLQMIAAGYLCNLRAKRVHLGVDLDEVGLVGGDFDEGSLGQLLQAEGAVEAVVEAYHQVAKKRKALVFGCTIQHAMQLTASFNDSGVKADIIIGTTPLEVRRRILKGFKSGMIKVLVNCGVLLEGYDEPSINCVIVARPTLSKLLYTQMIGRGTRKHPGKEDCLILDCVGAIGRHDLETMAALFGITEASSEKGIQELIEGSRQEQEELRVAGVTVQDVDMLKQSSLHWIQDGARYLLSVGKATLALQPEAEGTWAIRQIPSSRATRPLKLFSGLTLDYAQGTAEDLVRTWNVGALASVGMGWRHQPASGPQLGFLQKLGVQGMPRNSGEAADWITRKLAEGR